MAEYLNTPYAQPAIVCYCLNALVHNVGWNILHITVLKPKPLIEDTMREVYKKIAQGARYGFLIYLIIAVIAWWFPYVALVITVLTWIYWLFLSVAARISSIKG